MRRLLALAALVLSLGAGTASADTFAVVPDVPAGPFVLPSSEVPNEAGALLLPPGVFDAPFLPVQERAYADLHSLWLRAGGAYGIPWQVLAAINKIESDFGRNMGPSSAGAVGWMQFMPDTWLRWGMDASGDGIADPWNADDAIHAAARYLAAAEALQAAEELEVQTSARAEEAALRAAELELLSDRLVAEQDAFAAGQERLAAAAEVERLREELTLAEATLEAARSGAHSSSFLPAAADLLGMPSRADGYVFPVGGGPDTVSVGRQHHDYPAADIAAPTGTPVYALADAVVASLTDGGRCGIGLTLRSLDGLDWVYCHLSHRDAAVQPGVLLAAGQWVGLVGSTGHSTGPHLHLGLKPARYPQEMPWFQEFAGVAFTWQDVLPDPSFRTTPLLSVVPAGPDEPVADVVEFTLARG